MNFIRNDLNYRTADLLEKKLKGRSHTKKHFFAATAVRNDPD
jgi:hypothetical protein